MSSFEEVFRMAVKSANKTKNNHLRIGKVISVDQSNDTCTVDNFTGVRLNATIDNIDSQFTIYPAVGSYVILGRLEQSFAIIKYSKIERILIKVGSQTLEIKGNEILINEGNLGGLVKIQDLKLQYDSNIAAIKSAVGTGFASVDTALNAIASGTGVSKAAFDTAANTIVNLSLSTLENTKVKHG